MQNSMQLDYQSWTVVQERWCSLTREVYESNTPEVSVIPLWYQKYRLPRALAGKHPIMNATYTMVTTFSKWVASGSFSRIISWSHWWRCCTCIPNSPHERFRRSLRTAQAIYSSPGKDYWTGNKVAPMGIGWTGDGTCWYISTLYTVLWSTITMDEVRGWLEASLYHPHIHIHASLIRGGLEARMYSTS